MSLYLLAEPQKEIIKKAYSGKFKQPHISYLFDNTDMPDLKETGPVLLSDETADEQTFKQLLEKNSGLLISSNHTKEDVLAQLRHDLFVYFKPDQIGIFRYYDPYIASYFFSNMSAQETADWLGPIEKLQWFNTNWRDKVTTSDQWQQCYNPMAKDWQLDTERLKTKPVLTDNQNLALQDMQEEKFAYYWLQENQQTANQANISIDTIIYWVKKGIQSKFESKQHLNKYLSIRTKYPKASAPETWPNDIIENRIIYLEYHLHNQMIIG